MNTLANFSEGIQCSQHKEFKNFLKLFAKLKLFYESVLFRCSLLLFRYDLSILLSSVKDKPVNMYKH